MTTYSGGNYVQCALATYQPAPITRVLPSSILAQTLHPHFASTSRDKPIGRLFSTLGHIAVASVALVETIVFSLFALLTAPSYLVTTKIWNFAVLHTLASFRTLKMAGNGIIHRKMTPPPPPFFEAYMTKIAQIEKKILTHKSTPIVLGLLTTVALAYQSEIAPVKTSIDWAMRVCFPRKHSTLNFFADHWLITSTITCASAIGMYTICHIGNCLYRGYSDSIISTSFKKTMLTLHQIWRCGLLSITCTMDLLGSLLQAVNFVLKNTYHPTPYCQLALRPASAVFRCISACLTKAQTTIKAALVSSRNRAQRVITHTQPTNARALQPDH